MEPRVETSGDAPETSLGVEAYWRGALEFAERHYPDVLERYRTLRPEHVGPEEFFSEYVWCVYVSGFNSKVVDKKIGALLAAFGSWRCHIDDVWEPHIWSMVGRIVANRRKFDAVVKTKTLMQKMGWERFRAIFLTSTDHIGDLPFMGPVMRHHLARNIGLDTVKPDRHLVRLASHFGFGDPAEMCGFLAESSRERIGVVDVALFYAASTYGTRSL